jgi:SAM-dependent methyltransferase
VFAELLAYVRERIARGRLLLTLAIVVAAGFAVQPPVHVRDGVLRVALAVLLIVQFRLWGDIADREHDRRRHPERVLARHYGRAIAFLVLLAVLSLPIVLLLGAFGDAGRRMAAYGVLALALAVVYGSQATIHGRVMRTAWLLVQFPAFVLLTVPDPGAPSALVAAAIVYLLAMFKDWATSTDATDLRRTTLRAPGPAMFEEVACYACGSSSTQPFLVAEDDLSGRPGRFSYVRCRNCRLAFLAPRLKLEHAESYYDLAYVRLRGRPDWGWLTPLYERVRARHDRDKRAFLEREVAPKGATAELDVRIDNVPLADLRHGPRFDVITMWDYLHRQYEPLRALELARDLLAPNGRLVIETPSLDSRTWSWFRERWPGIQAPRNTVLFSRQSLEMMVESAGLEVASYHGHGTFPASLYVFAGIAFKLLKGHAAEGGRLAVGYELMRLVLATLAPWERRLCLAHQVVVCRLRAREVNAASPADASGAE